MLAGAGPLGYSARVDEPIFNAAAWIAHHAERDGARCAIVDGERRIGYGELRDRVGRCAAALAIRGIGLGDRVAILLGNRAAYLEVVLGAAQLGAIAVPINARCTIHEVRHVLDDCSPGLLVHDVEHAELARGACDIARDPPAARLGCGGEPDTYEAALAACAPRRDIVASGPEDPAILMYTSGTTGLPKGALLPCRKTVYNCRNAVGFFELDAEDRVLVALPLFHSFGLAILSLPALFVGATVVLQRRFDPDDVWRAVDCERITYFGGVPTMFDRLLAALPGARARGCDLSSLRFLFTAGSAIPVDLIHAFEANGLLLKQGYGQTETSILCCLDVRDAVNKAGSVGRPVTHAEIRVVRESSLPREPRAWEDVTVGETGEIVVRGPITMLGYWQRPEATAETIRGEWLRTHDLATVDSEGFITLVGRSCEMYISGGENVYPAEIEAVYRGHPDVDEIAVVGVPHATWGEAGRAFVVPVTGRSVDPEALLEWGRERLAAFKLPTEFVEIGALPRTVTGKLQKHLLPSTAHGDRAPDGRPAAQPPR